MPSDPRTPDLDVIVIGAGLAGLSCAVRLTDRGLRVGIDRLAERAGRTVLAAALMRVFAQMIGHNDAAFGFPKVGLSELYVPQAIDVIEQGGGCVMLGRGAAQLLWRDGRVTGVRTDRGDVMQARACVLAAPPSAAVSLLPGEAPARMATARMQPSPYISTYLWFDRRTTRERFWPRRGSPGKNAPAGSHSGPTTTSRSS